MVMTGGQCGCERAAARSCVQRPEQDKTPRSEASDWEVRLSCVVWCLPTLVHICHFKKKNGISPLSLSSSCADFCRAPFIRTN